MTTHEIGGNLEGNITLVGGLNKIRKTTLSRNAVLPSIQENDEKLYIMINEEGLKKWQRENNKTITLTGMRKEEGGQRASLKGCIVTDKDNKIVKFHPLLVVDEEFENWFIEKNNIKLCKLYYEPFNFKRTGCKGCPCALDRQEQLTIMNTYLPNERKQCEMIWEPVYKEYRRLGYRLSKKEQCKLF